MTKSPEEPAPDPNLAGFRAILEQKKQRQAAAEALKPQNLGPKKQKPRAKPQMRRRP